MEILNLFKTNKQKIQGIEARYSKYFCDIKFNDKIQTHNKNEFSNLCEEFFNSRQDPETLLQKVLNMKNENDFIIKCVNRFNSIFSDVEDKKIIKAAILFKNEYMNFQQLESNFMNDLNHLLQEIDNYKYHSEMIARINEKLETFNLFSHHSKRVNVDLLKDELIPGDSNNKNILKTYKKIERYIELEERLRDFFEKKHHLPYSENFIAFKNKWINIYKNLSYDVFEQDSYHEFKNEKNYFEELIVISEEVKEYQKEIREKLNDFFARVTVNKLLEKMFNTQLIELENVYKGLSKSYNEQNIEFSELIKEYTLINKSLIDLNSKYIYLLSPIKNTTNMLGIGDEKEIQDIYDYYIYSLSKSIEKEMNVYGTSKNIAEYEVINFIKLIEENLYTLTQDQVNAIYSSVELLNRKQNANCLIQGDVSSGKTIVTVALMFILALKKMKSVYIVPRRVLRLQHLKTLRDYNNLFGLNLNIYDSSEEFDINEADIILNGYSFSDKRFSEVEFDLGVIDEIQLFGVEQRNMVQKKYVNIDMFYTTATPHPRTKLISLIGNMDIIEIREMPPGRKPKRTEVFSKFEKKHHEVVTKEVTKGHLVLVVCPLVNKQGVNEFESLPTAYNKYKELFPYYMVEMLKTSYNDDKKEEIIEAAINGEIDILISTKSIEVGIDIPRASVMFIHYPHVMKIKWGVSQLHQLRGRIGRKNQDSFCYIEAPTTFDDKSPIGSVLKTQDVFELTKNDFNWRGFEKIIGTKQSGKSGSKTDQEKRIKAYEMIAKNTPKLIANLDYEFIKKMESYLINTRIENLN